MDHDYTNHPLLGDNKANLDRFFSADDDCKSELIRKMEEKCDSKQKIDTFLFNADDAYRNEMVRKIEKNQNTSATFALSTGLPMW